MYDKASIALIPSGTKASKLYSILPANGDGDFDFSRGSTATRVNKDGLIETVGDDIPRLDYPLTNGVVGDCPHLLLEPSRANLIIYSENFSQWGNVNSTETANQITSPDGSVTAYSIQDDSTNGEHYIQSNAVTHTLGNPYIAFAFIKKGSLNEVALNMSGGVSTTVFNVNDGTLVSGDGSIEDYGNGWFKCTIINSSMSFGSGYLRIKGYKDGSTTYVGDGSSMFYVWGAQFEAGSYQTSYIPTLQNQAETRSADICNGSGTSAEFNDSEGVLFAEIASFVSSGTSRRIAISDGAVSGGGNNRLEILYSSSTNLINFQVFSGGIFQGSRSYTVTDITDFNKVAVKYKKDDYALWINSVEVATMTSGNTPTGLNTLRFEDGSGGNDFYGKCKQLIYFNEALSDSELQTLTS